MLVFLLVATVLAGDLFESDTHVLDVEMPRDGLYQIAVGEISGESVSNLLDWNKHKGWKMLTTDDRTYEVEGTVGTFIPVQGDEKSSALKEYVEQAMTDGTPFGKIVDKVMEGSFGTIVKHTGTKVSHIVAHFTHPTSKGLETLVMKKGSYKHNKFAHEL